MKVLTLDDFSLEGKTVFLRVDMNCPIDMDTMNISGTKRIEEAIETIKALNQTKLVIASHQGRVGNGDYTGMDKHVPILENLLNKKIKYVEDVIGESAQREIKNLQDGEIFAFGLSEKEHGADIYASDMDLTKQEDGSYLASGSKYYIGNANEAALVATFGKFTDSKEYVWFVDEPKNEKYELVKKVINSQNYVAEYKLNEYSVTEKNILAKGRDAWDMALNTVNVGKFNLGWASIGICTHAYYEALNHAAHRNLFDHYVTDFIHVQQLFIDAYARLTAMKLFGLRAIDYMRVASPEDRRYLLFTPIVKMKVTTQGEEVINALWDVIAAKGFEKDMYFEMAARDIRAYPNLRARFMLTWR